MEPAAVITAIYATCNAIRLLSYGPQVVAIAREQSSVRAISLCTWSFWSFCHAVTAVYCYTVAADVLLSIMMCGNAIGSGIIVTLTTMKRFRHSSRGAHKTEISCA
jgi:hypothetical protein